jgi:hypothetical protein
MDNPCCDTKIDELIERAYKAMGKSYDKGAKLSTKKRKNLKKSTFCGPGRSFPVPDCAHYTAALRLLNRSKFSSSTKAKIRSCVMAKGKKLGCKGAKNQEKSYFITAAMKDLFAQPEWVETIKLVKEAEKNPGMDLEW